MSLDVGIYRGVAHDEYHADPCVEPSLNASVALTLLNRSPLHARHEHPRLGGQAKKAATRAMDTGSLVHSLLLGAGAGVAVLHFDDYRTKAAQQARDQAREAGQIPVLACHFDECSTIAEQIRWAVPLTSERELTIVWRSASALARCRLDAFDADAGIITDLKVVEDAARAADGKNIVGSGYDLRAANQTEAVEELLPALAGRVTFRLLFVESAPPYAVVEAELAGDLLELGRRKWRRAVSTWWECLQADSWPGPYRGRTRIEAPAWAMDADLQTEIRLGGGQRNSNDALGL